MNHERCEVKKLKVGGKLRAEGARISPQHDLSSVAMGSHDVLLCSHNQEPPPGTEGCLSQAVPLKGSPAWQLQDTVLKMSNQAICPERKITTAITALVEHRQNDENRFGHPEPECWSARSRKAPAIRLLC